MRKAHNKLKLHVVKSILRASRTGLPDNRVAELIGVGKTTVRSYREAAGLPLNGHKLRSLEAKIILLATNKAKCRRCKRTKMLKSFLLCASGYKNVCKKCLYLRTNEGIATSLRRYLAKRLSSVKNGAKLAGLTCNLSVDDMLEIYHKQLGQCFYTDVPMQIVGRGGKKQSHSLSVDKIIPSLGYTRKNVVFCTWRANVIKNDQTLEEMSRWMPSWYSRIQIFLEKF